jgi:hypothetical protein
MAVPRFETQPDGRRPRGAAAQSAEHPDEQRVWLAGSSHPVQVVLDGGHNIDRDDPAGVLAEIERSWHSFREP